MSAAAEFLSDLRAEIAEDGEAILIRRYSGTPRVAADTPAQAKVAGYDAKAIAGSILQGDRRLVVLAEGEILAILPVLSSDKAVIRGKELAIISVDDSTRRVGGVLIGLNIQVRG